MQSLSILVVDDDSLDRLATGRALRAGDADVRVSEAATCAEALAQLGGDTPPDLALLDFQLPDGDGLELLRRLKAQGLTTPVVVLTDHADERVAVELIKAGAADYLPKSHLTPETLWRCLRAALRLRHAEDEAEGERRARETYLQVAEGRLRTLYDITSSPEFGFDGTLERLLAEGCRQFGLESGMISQVGGERQQTLAAFPGGGSFSVGAWSDLEDTYCVDALRSNEALSIDTTADPQWRDRAAFRVHGVACYLGVSIAVRGRPWGTLCFFSGQPRDTPFTAGDREYVRLMAQWIGGELERREAAQEMRRSEERYRSLVDATAQLVWTNSPDGEMEAGNVDWATFTGQSESEYRGYGWSSAVHPDDTGPTLDAWRETVAARATFLFEHRVRRRDGVYRLFSIRAVPVLDAGGSLREWVGVHTDITERRQAEDRLGFLAEASTLLSSSLDYDQTLARVAQLAVPLLGDWCAVDLVAEGASIRRVFTAHADSEKRDLARPWREQHEVDHASPHGAAEVIRTGRSEMVRDIPDDLLTANIRDAEALQGGLAPGIRSYLCVPLAARGRTLGAITLVTAESERLYDAADLELAEDLARRAALAVDNARLYHETRARAEREALVNRIGGTLRGSLDPDEVLALATREVGEALDASRCVWTNFSPARDAFEVVPQQYTAPGVSPQRGTYLRAAYPAEVLAQWRAGECVAVGDVETDPRGAFVRDLTAPGGLRAFLVCPIHLRGEWVGLFGVHQTNRPRVWTAAEAALLASVADMLTLALENARLYTHEHRVAEMLQAAFLPDIPDRLHGLELAKMYRAGLEEAQVGGDLYDAFALPDSRVALVIADVSGKGLGAAVQTATVKYSLRAFAAEAASPSLVLHRLNRTLRREVAGLGEHFVTLFYAVFDPRTGRLTYAGAGHETQLIKRAGGGVTLLHANGPILGIAEHRYGQDVEYLHPGDALVLFTDGLTEARAVGSRELLDLDRVVDAVAGLDGAFGPGAVVSYLEDLALDWTSGRPHDDIALLVARRVAPKELEGDESELEEPALGAELLLQRHDSEEMLFGFSFPASPDYAAEVRQAVAHWMGLLGYDRAQVEDFQTAVTEAVANAVRHGSPHGVADTFRVSGYRRATEAFVVEVADSGPGLSVPLAADMPAPEATAGRGLPLMRTYADEVLLLPAATGLRLRLVKSRSARPDK